MVTKMTPNRSHCINREYGATVIRESTLATVQARSDCGVLVMALRLRLNITARTLHITMVDLWPVTTTYTIHRVHRYVQTSISTPNIPTASKILQKPALCTCPTIYSVPTPHHQPSPSSAKKLSPQHSSLTPTHLPYHPDYPQASPAPLQTDR